MPRKENASWVGFQATPDEKEILDSYCKHMQTSKTQILRSLVRTLSRPDGERDHWLLKLQLGAKESRIVDQYCKENHVTPSDAIRRAIELLGAMEIMHLSREDAEVFMAALENPPEPNERLRELLQSNAPWVISGKAAETEEEVALVERLRTMGEELISIAKILEDR